MTWTQLAQYALPLAHVIVASGLVYLGVKEHRRAEWWRAWALRRPRPEAKTVVAPHLHAPRRFP
jgi:hypothetical protein